MSAGHYVLSCPRGLELWLEGTSLMPGCSAGPAIPTSTKIHSMTPISSKLCNNDGQARLTNPRRRGALGGTSHGPGHCPTDAPSKLCGKAGRRENAPGQAGEQASLPAAGNLRAFTHVQTPVESERPEGGPHCHFQPGKTVTAISDGTKTQAKIENNSYTDLPQN